MDPIDYYNQNAKLFFESTVNLCMEEHLNKFVEYLPEGAAVLDLGCGSGRDSLYFVERGFDVTAIDGSEELCELASIHIGQDVLHMQFSELDFTEVFDGIWACASLLHVKEDDIDEIINKIINALKPDGIIYISLKHGNFSGIKDGRYYKYYDTKELKNLIGRHKELEILELWKSTDIRIDRADEMWINVIVKKINVDNMEEN